jgi:hypothetical protein
VKEELIDLSASRAASWHIASGRMTAQCSDWLYNDFQKSVRYELGGFVIAREIAMNAENSNHPSQLAPPVTTNTRCNDANSLLVGWELRAQKQMQMATTKERQALDSLHSKPRARLNFWSTGH